MGYTQLELDSIQERWNLCFPPDLIELLLSQRHPVGGRGAFDWILSDPETIQERLDWPFDGFWFDVKNNAAWWPEWGDKPESLSEQRLRLKTVFDSAPKLIPLHGHRYLPADPCESGNPIFSVYQMDIIYYGRNLADWIELERGVRLHDDWPHKEIPFWSEAARKANSPKF